MARGFVAVKDTTLCPYAETARIGYGPRWLAASTEDENWNRNAQALAGWAIRAQADRSHGFVLEVGDLLAADFEHIRAQLKTALYRLNALDPAGSNCMQGPFENLDWQFEFARLRLFVNVFAPCYPANHSKHTTDPTRFYLFLQPEYAFELCGVNPNNRAAKEYVRRRFQAAGRPYNGEMIDRRIEAYLYMFPISPHDDPVRWWD